MEKIKKDINLREAVNRIEQKLPPLPADLNERVLSHLTASPSLPRRSPSLLKVWWRSVAAVLVAVMALFAWKNYTTNTLPQTAKQENTPEVTIKRDTLRLPTQHVMIANATRYDSQRNVLRSKAAKPESQQSAEIQDAPAEPLPIEEEAPQEEEPCLIPAEKQALVDIFMAEEALQIVFELRAHQEAIRAYAASLTGEELPKPIIAF